MFFLKCDCSLNEKINTKFTCGKVLVKMYKENIIFFIFNRIYNGYTGIMNNTIYILL